MHISTREYDRSETAETCLVMIRGSDWHHVLSVMRLCTRVMYRAARREIHAK